MMRINALVLTLVLLMVVSNNVFAAEEEVLFDHHSPSPSPSHHHHYHHHPNHSSPSYPPVKPPTKPPTKAPVHPPVKPPTKPPVHPPVKPPGYPPVKPPSYPPMKPPSHPPMKPPSHFPRKFVSVQGVVYCKPCKYKGISTLTGASPLSGAEVKLECKNTKYKPLIVKGKTDEKGYFLVKAPKTITTYGARSCKVTLLSSPSKKCNNPTNLHAGISGSILIIDWKSVSNVNNPYALYNIAGPLAYEPSKCY